MSKELLNNSNFKWDVAFSLCKQDVEFARKLIKILNPGLKIFFYDDQQEKLIGKSGPEEFSKIFSEQCRIVIILSRKEWSESFYTEIEKNAIIDRMSGKNGGYSFIMVIPMEPSEIPTWYPLTRIYADPRRFSIEDLAKFIEFKIADEGGDIKPITLEDRLENLLYKINIKKTIIKLQSSNEAVQCAREEIIKLKNEFNRKLNFLLKGFLGLKECLELQEENNFGYIRIGDYELICKHTDMSELYYNKVTTQDINASLILNKRIIGSNLIKISSDERLFYYSENMKGWSKEEISENSTDSEKTVLYRNRDNSKYYDLSKPNSTEEWVDIWFQRLLELSSENIERYL